MEKYQLIEKEVKDEIQSLPIFYKKMECALISDQEAHFAEGRIYSKSTRHQTNSLISVRFYKHITLFDI